MFELSSWSQYSDSLTLRCYRLPGMGRGVEQSLSQLVETLARIGLARLVQASTLATDLVSVLS